MSNISFIQRSRIGRGIFLLRDETLEVTTSVFGIRSARTIPLRSIAIEYGVVAERFWILILVPLVLTLLALGVNLWILHDERLPDDLAIYPLMFAIPWTLLTFRGVPRVELFVFSDHWQRPLFHVVREREQAAECEAFVEALLDRIERAALEAGPSPPAPRLPGISAPTAKTPRLYWWKLSVVSGGLAAAVSALGPGGEWIEITFFSMMLGIAGALLFGAYSFLMKESLRLVSLIGVALALVAPLIDH